jgi:phage shock protein C
MKKLYKSDTDKVISGVIGGLGEYTDIDPTLLRLAYILVAIVTALIPSLIVYIIASVIVPHKPHHIVHEAK